VGTQRKRKQGEKRCKKAKDAPSDGGIQAPQKHRPRQETNRQRPCVVAHARRVNRSHQREPAGTSEKRVPKRQQERHTGTRGAIIRKESGSGTSAKEMDKRQQQSRKSTPELKKTQKSETKRGKDDKPWDQGPRKEHEDLILKAVTRGAVRTLK